MQRCWSWGFVIGSLLLFTSAAHAECTKDTECEGDHVCNAGACIAPTSAPADDANGWGTPPPAAEVANPAASAGNSGPAVAVPTQPANTPRVSAAADSQQAPATKANSNLRERVMRPKSTALVVAGVVTLSASAFTLYGAYAAANLALFCSIGESRSECRDYGRLAIGLGVATVALIGVGIPLIVIGSKRVPTEAQPKASRRSPSAPAAALSPFVTAESAGLSFQLLL
jgi:hypothetical protein